MLARFSWDCQVLPAQAGQHCHATEVLRLRYEEQRLSPARADTSSISPRAVLGADVGGLGHKASSL